jgi:hypothetical protein
MLLRHDNGRHARWRAAVLEKWRQSVAERLWNKKQRETCVQIKATDGKMHMSVSMLASSFLGILESGQSQYLLYSLGIKHL